MDMNSLENSLYFAITKSKKRHDQPVRKNFCRWSQTEKKLLPILSCIKGYLIQTSEVLLLPVVMHLFCHRFAASFFLLVMPPRSALVLSHRGGRVTYATLERPLPPKHCIITPAVNLSEQCRPCVPPWHLHGHSFLGIVICKPSADQQEKWSILQSSF